MFVYYYHFSLWPTPIHYFVDLVFKYVKKKQGWKEGQLYTKLEAILDSVYYFQI